MNAETDLTAITPVTALTATSAEDLHALPVLYSFRRCPYAMRARLGLASSGTVCELREIVLRDKPASLLSASPKATVPVLVLPSGQVIDQSLDIMLWALRQKDPQGWLTPENDSVDEMVALISGCDQGFKADLDRYKYPHRFGADSTRHRSQGLAWLHTLAPRLKSWPFLSGPRPALADAAIAPFVRQFAQTDMPWFEAQADPAVSHWLAHCLAMPLFEQVMQKYPVWMEGTMGTLFPSPFHALVESAQSEKAQTESQEKNPL